MLKGTVLVTGSSGFIAKHVVLALTNAGYGVRGTLRDTARAGEVRAAVEPHLTDRARIATLDFTRADLGSSEGWNKAMEGVEAVMHTASPFPIAQPKNPADLIRPAVEGTERVLKAALEAGVGRVVLTSSSVAVMEGTLPAGKAAFDESDWSDLTRPGISAYTRSKTMAEQAAWDIARASGGALALTTINPTLVAGPPLDRHFGSSVSVIARILRGKDPMQPRFGLPVVDVRDVALAHLRALERPESAGQRYITSEASLWFRDMAEILQLAYPDRRISTRVAPDLALRLMAWFDKDIRAILPALGVLPRVSSAKATRELGISFTPAREAVLASAAALVGFGLV